MRPDRRRWACGCVSLAVLLVACGETDPDRPALPPERELHGPVDTLVTTASALLGLASDLAVHPDGRFFVADESANQIHVFDPDGTFVRSIGGPGQGPGELSNPQRIRVSGDTLAVAEYGSRRHQLLTLEGAHLGVRPWAGGYPPALGPGGMAVHPTLGLDSILASVRGPDGEERARLGRPLAPVTRMVNLSRMKAQVEDGEVPDIFLNTAMVEVDREGGVWLAIAAEGRVERYEPNGARALSVTLDEPEFVLASDRFIERNRHAAPNQVFPLEYFRDMRAVGERLWLLLDTDDGPAALVVLSPEGDVVERIRVPAVRGSGLFAVDEGRGLVYFLIPDRAQLVRVSLE